ncbi:hypothetical protein EIN_267450 [Entamoeba invadens IP1]|uniref:TLDc domain-containing protein n=1 Tax=Entamoeba invadens IP1 TaxID=370355 RepID=A0A0A1U7X2_ENTIV|nr:hypothetical protein EIN_267450 [Entamoeba invadens IP1]ELP91029.1 hypothetical protein EIN_267450 [Entamoeba invadens IP1]|eukprot:XP_004257800.1 hypothetical protein EIN_267450 [Entamoeba invadens IP1]
MTKVSQQKQPTEPTGTIPPPPTEQQPQYPGVMHVTGSIVISQLFNNGVINFTGTTSDQKGVSQQPQIEVKTHSSQVVKENGKPGVSTEGQSSSISPDDKRSEGVRNRCTEKYERSLGEFTESDGCGNDENSIVRGQSEKKSDNSLSDPELSTVTTILKSMESDLKELIIKEKTITETVNQLTESKKTLKSPSQVQDLHEQVESNEKMLERVSSEFGRLKQFSTSMSEMVRPSASVVIRPTITVPQKLPSLEEMVVEPVIGQLKFQKKIVEWTNMCQYRVLYRSTKDNLTAKALNAKICGRTNILLIVITNKNYVFGSYSSVAIPNPPKIGDHHVGPDNAFFCFTFQNPFNTEPLKITKKTTSTSLKIYSNKEQSYVVGVDACFYIRANCPSHVPSCFAESFDDPTKKGGLLFVNAVYPDKFGVQELMAVELSN